MPPATTPWDKIPAPTMAPMPRDVALLNQVFDLVP